MTSQETVAHFNVLAGSIEYAVSKGAFTISELKQIIPALEAMKEFIEAGEAPTVSE